MAIQDLSVRRTAIMPRASAETAAPQLPTTRTPNRKSLAKKAWWAKKREEEARAKAEGAS